jgi:predicted O-methyltransferase YrrM
MLVECEVLGAKLIVAIGSLFGISATLMEKSLLVHTSVAIDGLFAHFMMWETNSSS